MGNDEAVEWIAGPGFREGGRDHAVECVRRDSDIECLLQRANGVGGGCVHATNLIEELQLQRDGRREEQLRLRDQRKRFFADFFRLATDDPDDGMGIKADGVSTDHSWDQSSSTRSSGSPMM